MSLRAWYRKTALEDIRGVSAERVNDGRLYRALDRLVGPIERQIARLLGKNSRAAGRYCIEVEEDETVASGLRLAWSIRDGWEDWVQASEGCYVLRSNVTEWTGETLWQTYTQLTQAEAAFRIHKSDLSLRSVWYQKEKRVKAHILVCFLAYALFKNLEKWQQLAGLGNSPRVILGKNSSESAVRMSSFRRQLIQRLSFESAASFDPIRPKQPCSSTWA